MGLLAVQSPMALQEEELHNCPTERGDESKKKGYMLNDSNRWFRKQNVF